MYQSGRHVLWRICYRNARVRIDGEYDDNRTRKIFTNKFKVVAKPQTCKALKFCLRKNPLEEIGSVMGEQDNGMPKMSI